MSVELEYAVKKDIRNNSVVRQTDARQRADLYRMLVLVGFVVAMLLFSAWQHFGRLDAAMAVERLRVEQERENTVNRQLRLNLERLLAADALAARATELGLRPATLKETLVIERIVQPDDAGSVLARVR